MPRPGALDANERSPQDGAWLRYLYERHSPQELVRWARSLSMFRFCRAHGGFANDGDALQFALRFDGETDLLALLVQLGIPVQRYGPDTLQPVLGRAYSSEEFQRFPNLVHGHPSIGQPSHGAVCGVVCHVWVTDSRLTITISSETDQWDVDEAAVERARRLEFGLKHFASSVADRLIDPPIDSRNCLCPKYYPEIWSDR